MADLKYGANKTGYQLLIDEYVDAYSELIGFPGSVMQEQVQFDSILLDKAKDKKEYRQLVKDNMHKGPIGDYLYNLGPEGWEEAIQKIENKLNKAQGGIVSLNQMTRPIGYR